ncbi:TetR/AcrR family transcriptional regulator [Paenibacillus sp. CAU 1782]
MSEQSKLLMQQFMEAFQNGAGDANRRNIMLHAVDVFSKKGYTGAKIKDIAASAGFSQGYVYSYYKSKDELFVKIAEIALNGASQSVIWASRLPGSPLERITWLTEAYLASDSVALQHWRFNLLLSAAADGVPEEAKSLAEQKRSEPIANLVPLLLEGQAIGEIAEGNPVSLAIAYFSLMQGLGLTRAGMESDDGLFPSVEMALRLMKRQT